MSSESLKRAKASFDKKCKYFHVKYTENEHIESDAFSKLCEDSGIKANSYLKNLIRKEIKEKGYLDQNY